MKVIVMMMMVMMMKVIMLVFKTSVCRKVTPTHRVPEHSLLPFLNLASQATPVPGEDNNEHDDKVETIKEASKENTCNIILHDDVTCTFFSFHRLHFNFISTSNFQSYGRPRNARPGGVGDGEGIQCFPFLARKRNLSIFLLIFFHFW